MEEADKFKVHFIIGADIILDTVENEGIEPRVFVNGNDLLKTLMFHDVHEWKPERILNRFLVGDCLPVREQKVVFAPQLFFRRKKLPLFIRRILVHFMLVKHAVPLLLGDPFVVRLKSSRYEAQVISVMLTVFRLSLVDSIVNFFETEFKGFLILNFENLEFVGLLDSETLVNRDQYQKFAIVCVLDELKLDTGFAFQVLKVEFYLFFERQVEYQDKVPVFDGFLPLFWKQPLRSRLQKLKQRTRCHFYTFYLNLFTMNSLCYKQ